MTQYSTLNVIRKLISLKSAIKNRTGVTLNLSLNIIGDSNDKK